MVESFIDQGSNHKASIDSTTYGLIHSSCTFDRYHFSFSTLFHILHDLPNIVLRVNVPSAQQTRLLVRTEPQESVRTEFQGLHFD